MNRDDIVMNVKDLRKKTGLSQSKFANLFNIPVRTIQQWEQGVRKPPDYVIFMMEKIIITDHYIEKDR